MTSTRMEHDSLGPVPVPADKLWGAQTQRSLEHFSIGEDLISREMIPAYAIIKKAAAACRTASTFFSPASALQTGQCRLAEAILGAGRPAWRRIPPSRIGDGRLHRSVHLAAAHRRSIAITR